MRITTHIIYLAKRTDFEFSKKYAPARRKVEELVTKEAIFHYVDAVPRSDLPRKVRAKSQARSSTHPVLQRLLAMG